jgi:CRP-like cAMP-binding protein
MLTFRDFINNNIGVEDNEWQMLEKQLTIKHYKKGETISFKNDIWTSVMYINSGIVRSYIMNEQGKDFTRQFYFNTLESRTANLFVVDLSSLTTQLPSNRTFEVLSDCEVIIFSRENLYGLYEKYKKWEFVGRRMAELAYIDMDLFYFNLLTKTPKERYEYLKKTMAALINEVPQYHIASYLGITPVSLSRIKNQSTKEKEKSRETPC